ncbi:glycosyltransferase family 4 protein [Pedobacter sp. AW31-3R]|uniref:glycosyltransferase family 4 protein n=1 Tax=Pedobacter sp. AW31-3R TaxID=3445781 RepID=UPI003F9FE2E5
MSKKIVFLTLETFRATGGIQKMGRVIAHALAVLGRKNNWDIRVYSSNDAPSDLLTDYIPSNQYQAFSKNKFRYTLAALRSGLAADLIILSHVNLSLIGCLLKLFNPRGKIWLIAHGIEVWRPLNLWKKWIWSIADQVICVSRFTKEEVMNRQGARPDQCTVLNNALDPFLRLPEDFTKPAYLQERYHLDASDQVVFTLTRMAGTEKFKGYDQVIKALAVLRKHKKGIKYILAGPCEGDERIRVKQLVQQEGLKGEVILTGFIPEAELADHFMLADLFVMPSKKEGFGIVFIEAMAFGLPVICGNADGSLDAVRNPAMGTAIDPDNQSELEEALLLKLQEPLSISARKAIQQQCFNSFNAQEYRNRLEKLILDENAT